MSVSVSMPQLGESVTEGTVTRWLKREGERVEADEPLLEVSTDKVDTEIPSPVSGVLRGITVAEDETVAVGAELAVIDEEGSADPGASAAAGSDVAQAGGAAQDDGTGPADGAAPGTELADSGGLADDTGYAQGAAQESGQADGTGQETGAGTAAQPPGSGSAPGFTDPPAAQAPAGDVPTARPAYPPPYAQPSEYQQAAPQPPSYQQPAYQAPAPQPAAEPPSHQPPSYQPPTYQPPSYQPPTYQPPAYQPPAAGPAAPQPPAGAPGQTAAAAADQSAAAAEAQLSADGADSPYVTPLVRKLAAEHGVDLATISGTGVGGRIRKQDVLDVARTQRDSGLQQQAAGSGTAQQATAGQQAAAQATAGQQAAGQQAAGQQAAGQQAAGQQAAGQQAAGQQAAGQQAAGQQAAGQQAAGQQAAGQQAAGQQAAGQQAAGRAGLSTAATVLPAAGAPAGAAAERPAIVPSRLRGTTERLSRARQVIAQRMVESLQTSAQLTTVVEADVTAIARLRDRAKAGFEAREGVKLSFLPFFALTAVEALKVHPKLNAVIDTASGQVTYHDAEHLGIAVDTERGLMVPVIRDAGDLNIAGLARKIADLAQRTRAGQVSPDDLSGGTFTLTNTGSRGALFDTPIINQPQVGILGTGTVVKRAVVVEDPALGEVITVRSMVYLALTYDHRLVDGADAARFLVTMKSRLEEGAFETELGL